MRFQFMPNPVTVPVGATVVWTNNDPQEHDTTSEDGLWASPELATGESFSFTFTSPGTYEYVCLIHAPRMRGTVIVQAAGAAAQPAAAPAGAQPTPRPTAPANPQPTPKPAVPAIVNPTVVAPSVPIAPTRAAAPTPR